MGPERLVVVGVFDMLLLLATADNNSSTMRDLISGHK
jgi:hypothetical protein